MFCPKCGAETPTDECIKCGIVISKYIAQTESKGEPVSETRKKFEVYQGEKPSAKKALILNFLFFLIVLIIYFAACPFLTVRSIKESLEQQDENKLADYIDYDALRQNLKQQYDKKIIDGMRMAGNNPFADLTAAYVSKITEPMVEKTLAIEELAVLMTGHKQLKYKGTGSQMDEVASGGNKDMSGIFLEARQGYASFNSFSVKITNEKGKETEIILKRTGAFTWVIEKIILPV